MMRHAGPLSAASIVALAGLLAAVAPEEDPQTPAEVALPEGTSVRQFGALGDGKKDDTAAFQRAVLARVGDVWVPRGVYRITQTVEIPLDSVGPTSVCGHGTARIVMEGPGPALRFVGTHGGTAAPETVKPEVWTRQRMPQVRGLEILGAHPKATGIEATGTMQLVVTGVSIRRALHGIHLRVRNRNVIISDSHLYQNRGIGIYLDDVNLHQINITGCHVSYNEGGGVVARAGNVRNIQVTGCDIEGNMPPRRASASKVGAESEASREPTANILIDGNGGSWGIAEVAVTGCTIQHTQDSPNSANIRFVGIDASDREWGHLTIANNVLSDTQINIDLLKARGVSIVGNTFWKGGLHNLRILDSSHIVIGPNVMDRNPRYQDQEDANDGVLLSDCRDCTITGLHISGVRRAAAGLVLESCHRVNVTGCSILDCDRAGILLKDVTGSRLSGCLIQNSRPDAGDSWVPIRQAGQRGTVIGDKH